LEQLLIELVKHLGYLGIFIATLIESTFIPIPAEVTMIPAGMLAAEGYFNYWGLLVTSTAGVLTGSLVNYWIGLRFGRAIIIKYGSYVLLKHQHLMKTELFFAKYGKLAVFLGRLLVGVKHYIAFVAGIARMRLKAFIISTSLGGLVWMWIILHIGYMTKRSNTTVVGELEIILISVAVVTLIAWLIKRKFMKH